MQVWEFLLLGRVIDRESRSAALVHLRIGQVFIQPAVRHKNFSSALAGIRASADTRVFAHSRDCDSPISYGKTGPGGTQNTKSLLAGGSTWPGMPT